MTRASALVLRAFAVWTIWVWATRIWNIVGDDEHDFAFKAVHSALALVSVAFAVATLVIVAKTRRRAASPGLQRTGEEITR